MLEDDELDFGVYPIAPEPEILPPVFLSELEAAASFKQGNNIGVIYLIYDIAKKTTFVKTFKIVQSSCEQKDIRKSFYKRLIEFKREFRSDSQLVLGQRIFYLIE